MNYYALFTLITLLVAGFVAIFFTSFGTLIIFLGTFLFAIWTKFEIVSLPAVIFVFLLYLIGEVLEFFLMILGAKKLGASNSSIVGAVIGGIAGAILGAMGLLMGVILGTLLGIFLGAFLVELFIKRDFVKSLKAGAGSLLGRLGAVFVKAVVAFVIIGYVVFRVIQNT